jgi:hypothetical protein
MLCLDCLGERIGRALAVGDFRATYDENWDLSAFEDRMLPACWWSRRGHQKQPGQYDLFDPHERNQQQQVKEKRANDS